MGDVAAAGNRSDLVTGMPVPSEGSGIQDFSGLLEGSASVSQRR